MWHTGSDERRACSSDVALELGAAGMGGGGRHAMADARADAAGRLIIKYIYKVCDIITLGSSPHSLLLSEAANDGRRERS